MTYFNIWALNEESHFASLFDKSFLEQKNL